MPRLTTRVDDVPVLVVTPPPDRANGRLALWQPFLSGAKEAVEPFLHQLADDGFHAVAFDPWRHGERADPDVDLIGSVFGDFRRRMWTILGRSVPDGLLVIDWALDRYDLHSEVAAGGISMGGDLALALAGVDRRITRVATLGSTPDWTRPGMTRLDQPDVPLPQGEPDAAARALYDAFDPMTHLERYRDRPAIAFEFGVDDRHIPAANAEAFVAAIESLEGTAEHRITRHPGHDHLTSGRDEAILARCRDWLAG